jgi:hypothetical protein
VAKPYPTHGGKRVIEHQSHGSRASKTLGKNSIRTVAAQSSHGRHSFKIQRGKEEDAELTPLS